MDYSALTPLDPAYKKVMGIQFAVASLPFLAGAVGLEFAHLLYPGVILGPVVAIATWFVLGMPGRRYRHKGYAMSADRLRVVKGYLFRRDTVVPFGRVQHLDVLQGPLERGFGLATLVMHTAGTHNSSVHLAGLRHGDAVAMREAIRDHIRREEL